MLRPPILYALSDFIMGVWQGLAMDTLKFHPGPPCPSPCPLKRPYSRFRDGMAGPSETLGSPLPYAHVYGKLRS
jgi:hypothetical protein